VELFECGPREIRHHFAYDAPSTFFVVVRRHLEYNPSQSFRSLAIRMAFRIIAVIRPLLPSLADSNRPGAEWRERLKDALETVGSELAGAVRVRVRPREAVDRGGRYDERWDYTHGREGGPA
jgi:hypothetical protein